MISRHRACPYLHWLTRMWCLQMKTHDHLIIKAPVVVSDRIQPIYMRQMDILHKAERFRPSYNVMKQRHDDVRLLPLLLRACLRMLRA